MNENLKEHRPVVEIYLTGLSALNAHNMFVCLCRDHFVCNASNFFNQVFRNNSHKKLNMKTYKTLVFFYEKVFISLL